MQDLEREMLLKYIHRKYYETENDLVRVKNRVSVRRPIAEDFMDLALQQARYEAANDILDDLTIILQNYRS